MKTTGIRSAGGTAAYWRMQFESTQSALAEVIAENTENVEALLDVVTDYGQHCDDLAHCACSMARASRLTAHMRMDAAAPTRTDSVPPTDPTRRTP